MDMIILHYPTAEVDILRNVDADFIEDIFAGDVELYLEDRGYNTNDIHYMCAEEIVINEK